MSKHSQILFPMKRFVQGPSDDLCAVKCLESIYGYFGMPHPTSYFIKELALADELAYLPQLLRLPAKDGLNVRANISNPQIFDLAWNGLSSKELLKKLQQRHEKMTNSDWKRAAREYMLYVEEGNPVSQEVISEQLLIRCLEEKKVVLALLDNVIFHQRTRRYWDAEKQTYDIDDIRGKSDGHGVVINGWDPSKGFHIVDASEIQSYDASGQYWVEPAVLMAGIYSLSGEIGMIWKK